MRCGPSCARNHFAARLPLVVRKNTTPMTIQITRQTMDSLPREQLKMGMGTRRRMQKMRPMRGLGSLGLGLVGGFASFPEKVLDLI